VVVHRCHPKEAPAFPIQPSGELHIRNLTIIQAFLVKDVKLRNKTIAEIKFVVTFATFLLAVIIQGGIIFGQWSNIKVYYKLQKAQFLFNSLLFLNILKPSSSNLKMKLKIEDQFVFPNCNSAPATFLSTKPVQETKMMTRHSNSYSKIPPIYPHQGLSWILHRVVGDAETNDRDHAWVK